LLVRQVPYLHTMAKIYDVTFEQGQGGTGTNEQDKKRQQRGGSEQSGGESDQSY
jgi:hypothetical protein